VRPWVYPSMRTTERVRQSNDGAGTCYETVPNKNAVRGSLSLSPARLAAAACTDTGELIATGLF
jgi:hypothetical protein